MADRSPRYPAIDLADAISEIKKLYEKEGKTPLSAEDAASALGLKGLTGPARSKIGALKKYGLLDSAGGKVRASARAIAILVEPEASSARNEAVRQAALAPELFKELYETHHEASDQTITSYLIRQKDFTQRGAAVVTEAFRRTIQFAGLVGTADNTVSQSSGQDQESEREKAMTDKTARGAATQSGFLGPNTRILAFPLSPSMNAELRFSGEPLTGAHLERLAKLLEVIKSALEYGVSFGEINP